MLQKDINVDGKLAKGYEIDFPNAKLVVAVAPKGFVMCGYLNLEAADKFSDCAAVVRGVKTIEELLSKEVSVVSERAKQAGIIPSMTGFQALSRMF